MNIVIIINIVVINIVIIIIVTVIIVIIISIIIIIIIENTKQRWLLRKKFLNADRDTHAIRPSALDNVGTAVHIMTPSHIHDVIIVQEHAVITMQYTNTTSHSSSMIWTQLCFYTYITLAAEHRRSAFYDQQRSLCVLVVLAFYSCHFVNQGSKHDKAIYATGPPQYCHRQLCHHHHHHHYHQHHQRQEHKTTHYKIASMTTL
jgi:hypothetical protein